MSSVVSRGKNKSGPKVQTVPKRAPRSLAAREGLIRQIKELLETEIRFVYAAEFERLDGDVRPIAAARELLENLRDLTSSAVRETPVVSSEQGGVADLECGGPFADI